MNSSQVGCRVCSHKATLQITSSIGWAVLPWEELEPKLVSHEQVLMLADYVLYHAKGSGRDLAVGLLPARARLRVAGVAAQPWFLGQSCT